MRYDRTTRDRVRGGLRAAALGALLAVPLAGCDLDVDNPDIILPGNLTGEDALPTLRAGAIGDFAYAYSGDSGLQEGIVLAGGMLADEFMHSGTFPTRREWDIRNIDDQNATNEGVFRELQRARFAASSAAEAIAEFSGDGTADPRYAEMLNLEGLTYVLMAEHFCSGIPFSRPTDTGELEYGQPQTTQQVFEAAITVFDEAIASAQGAVQLNTARVGKARAQLNLGRYAEAAATVSAVPTSYMLLLNHSINSTRQENGVFAFMALFERWSVANEEGGEGLAFRGDPARVPWFRSGGTDLGFDGSTPQYDLYKYPGRDAFILVADGVEARLIEAEAALQAGDAAGMVAILNDLRTSAGAILSQRPQSESATFEVDPTFSMDPVVDPGTQAGRVDLLFSERAFWLYATGHRVGDLRRLIRQYNRTEDETFPSGDYFKGGIYGDDVNLPVPFDEENNPNFTGCIDRNA